MSDQFVAEIRMFPFNFAPTGWAFCDGQLIPISQNTALFALLGTVYGGDGKSTFALPDLQGRAAMQPGQGPGLSLYDLGQESGTESITLLQSEIPQHTHQLRAVNDSGLQSNPGGAIPAAANIYAAGPGSAPMAPLTPSGGGLPHNNMQPYLTVSFCIALQGIFPQRP